MSPVRHIAPSYHGRHRRSASRRPLVAAVTSLCAVGTVVMVAGLAAPAGAAPATVTPAPKVTKPVVPIGSTPKFTATKTGLTVTGWAADANDFGKNLRVWAVLDGTKTLGGTTTSLANAAVTKKYRTGATPGYSLAVAVPTGNHVVCLVLENIGGGQRMVKQCVATPLGRALTSSQRAKRSPVGAVQSATTTSSTVRLVGWASDPDLVSRRSTVVLYLDGRSTATRTTTKYVGTLPKGAGGSSRFDISVPVARATHIACLWVVNVGFGSNKFLGCKALDTRATGAATPASAAPATPALNTKVVQLALKQRGKPYVWGATGSKSFDCSGLVMWAYGKYGYRTPRVSQDQIKAARLIPASRAVPGDLVFYHDSVGDVYHVGIYLSPGRSFAAISTDQGVNYQTIWDPTATYGSFTHT